MTSYSTTKPTLAQTESLGAPFIFATCMTTLAVGSVYMSQPLFGEFASTFGVSPAQARVSFSWPMIVYAGAFFLFGPMTGVYPVRRLLAIGGGVAGVGLALASFAPTFDLMLAALCLAGGAAAIVPAASFALAPRAASPGRAGLYFGVLIAASVIGLTLGRSLSGVAAAAAGWRAAFAATGLLLMALAILTLAMFPSSERRSSSPSLLDAYARVLRLLGSSAILARLSIGAFLFFGYLGLTTFLTLRLQDAPFNLPVDQIGYLGFTGVIAVAGSPFAGAAIPWAGAKPVAALALAATLAGLVLMTTGETLAVVAFALLLVFVGVFSCQPAVMVMLSDVTPAQSKGAMASVYMVACLGSGGLASLVLGPVWRSAGWNGVGVACFLSVFVALTLAVGLRAPGRPSKPIAQ